MSRIRTLRLLHDGRRLVLRDDGTIWREVDRTGQPRRFEQFCADGLPESAEVLDIQSDAAGGLIVLLDSGEVYATAREPHEREYRWRPVDLTGLP